MKQEILTPDQLDEIENYSTEFHRGMGCSINCAHARVDLPLTVATIRELGRRANGVVSEEGPAKLSDGFDLLREISGFAPKEGK